MCLGLLLENLHFPSCQSLKNITILCYHVCPSAYIKKQPMLQSNDSMGSNYIVMEFNVLIHITLLC